MGMEEAAEVAAAASEGRPTYRNSRGIGGGGGGSDAYGRSSYSLPQMATGVAGEVSAEQAALENYLMEQAVDAGMVLHHARLESAHNRFVVSLRFAELLEEVEMEDVRRGVAPVLEGTGQKMPTWIRASEFLAPEMPALNEAAAKAEIVASEAELKRVKNSLMDQIDALGRLLAETDPQAGIRVEDLPAPPEALEDLFWDDETLLPGVGNDEEDVDAREGGAALLTQFLKEILPDSGSGLEFTDLGGGGTLPASLQELGGEVSSALRERSFSLDADIGGDMVGEEEEEEEDGKGEVQEN